MVVWAGGGYITSPHGAVTLSRSVTSQVELLIFSILVKVQENHLKQHAK